MAEIYPTNTLDEAAAWLAERTGDDWTAAKLLSAGAVGKLSLLAINPDWIAPGIGELKRQRNVEVVSLVSGKVFPLCPGEPVASVSDGFVATSDWMLRTLLSHGRVNLINAPGVIGVAPFIDASHLRVLKEELKRFGAALPPGTQKTAPTAEKNESPAPLAPVVPPAAQNVTLHKLKTNTLDVPIEKAINQAGNRETAAVWLKLKELALAGEPPFTGTIDGAALCYTNDDNQTIYPDGSNVKFSKDALRKRLEVRRQMEGNGGSGRATEGKLPA